MIQLYLPVKPRFITQKFGETANIGYYQANKVPIVGHNGIDFQAYHKQPVYASHDGTAYYQTDDKLGHGVVIRSNDTFTYTSQSGTPYIAYYKTIYWHFCNPDEISSPIPTNDTPVQVKAGDHIGWADSTGLSTGDHLHFGLKPCAIGEPGDTWYNIEQNNGYMGCIDPAPYLLDNMYAEDLPTNRPFLSNITIGSYSSDVVYLQKKLQHLGLFNSTITGYYGPITKAAVYAFQQKYVATDVSSKIQVAINRGDGVYALTRAALNSL